MSDKKICPGCGTELKFMNTPNFGGGKLMDGNRVCRSCFSVLAKNDVSFGLKSKKNYDSKMVSEIIQGNNKKDVIPERPIPNTNSRKIKVPKDFEDELVNDANSTDQDVIDTIVLIEYEDAKGNLSSRRITIKSIDYSKEDFLVKAYCHERKAARSFKSSRIREIIDIETGELIENPIEFLSHNSNSLTSWMNEHKDEILMMTYMAKSDGYFHPEEREILKGFIITEFGKDIDHELIDSEIRRFHCDSYTFRRSLENVSSKSIGYKERIYNLLGLIAKSDGHIDPVEKGILELIHEKFS